MCIRDRAYLHEHGYGVITRLSRTTIADLVEKRGVEYQPELCTQQGYRVFWHEGARYCLCYSPWRALRDAARRENCIEKARAAYARFSPGSRPLHAHAARLTRLLTTAKASPYFRMLERDGRMALEEDTAAVRAEQAWDGHYLLLCTDADVADERIAASYKQLRKIEEDFKVVKSVLETRPMYHWKLRRIHGHLIVCFLALWLERWLSQRFTAAGVTTSVTTLLRDWQHIQRGVITVQGARVPLHTLTNLTEERRAQLEQVGLLKVVTQLTKWRCS